MMMIINVGRGEDADGRHGRIQMMTEGRRHATTMLLLQGPAQLSSCGVCVFACGYWSCSENEILLGGTLAVTREQLTCAAFVQMEWGSRQCDMTRFRN